MTQNELKIAKFIIALAKKRYRPDMENVIVKDGFLYAMDGCTMIAKKTTRPNGRYDIANVNKKLVLVPSSDTSEPRVNAQKVYDDMSLYPIEKEIKVGDKLNNVIYNLADAGCYLDIKFVEFLIKTKAVNKIKKIKNAALIEVDESHIFAMGIIRPVGD